VIDKHPARHNPMTPRLTPQETLQERAADLMVPHPPVMAVDRLRVS
jgi:hypothetical protein